MRNMKLHTLFLFLLLAGQSMLGQTVIENYNTGSINQRESACWLFDDFEINNNNPINTGGNRKHGATVGMDAGSWWWGTSRAGFTTPFYYFNGTGTITFKHKADDDDYSFLAGGYLRVYLISPYNGATTVRTHVYKQVSFFNQRPNGPPDVTQNTTINITWTGFYRVEWEWVDYSSANTDYYIDDISIDTATGVFTETDIVCLDESATHTPTGAVNTTSPFDFEYTWNWVGTPGGTLTTQTTNDRTAAVDWNVGPGTYRLRSVETYDNGNCNGRIFYIDVTVRQQPNYTASVDTVCEDFPPLLHFEGNNGTAPYDISYNDGSGVQTFTTIGSTATRSLNANATSVDIISVTDANGCPVDAATLGSIPISYHPTPATGPIYH